MATSHAVGLRTASNRPIHRPMRLTRLFWAAALVVFARTASPTSVVAPTFDELVARAENIVVAEVVATRSTVVDSRAGRAIVTDVIVSIARTLKGPIYAQRSLELLGGTVGDETLTVAGMPEFHVGDRDVLFIRDTGRPVSPIVGFMYGRFRIVRDPRTGVEMLRTHGGRPLATIDEVGSGRPAAILSPPRTMTLDDFVRAVADKVRAQAAAR